MRICAPALRARTYWKNWQCFSSSTCLQASAPSPGVAGANGNKNIGSDADRGRWRHEVWNTRLIRKALSRHEVTCCYVPPQHVNQRWWGRKLIPLTLPPPLRHIFFLNLALSFAYTTITHIINSKYIINWTVNIYWVVYIVEYICCIPRKVSILKHLHCLHWAAFCELSVYFALYILYRLLTANLEFHTVGCRWVMNLDRVHRACPPLSIVGCDHLKG